MFSCDIRLTTPYGFSPPAYVSPLQIAFAPAISRDDIDATDDRDDFDNHDDSNDFNDGNDSDDGQDLRTFCHSSRLTSHPALQR